MTKWHVKLVSRSQTRVWLHETMSNLSIKGKGCFTATEAQSILGDMHSQKIWLRFKLKPS